MPSKYIENGFLELFIRYKPSDNQLLRLICPEAYEMEYEPSLLIGFQAGIKADSVIAAMTNNEEYDKRLQASIDCQTSMFEVYINGVLKPDLEYAFQSHQPLKEKGYLSVIDVSALSRGRHVVELKSFRFKSYSAFGKQTIEELEMTTRAKINFWIQ
jgi:hypothetical protein